MVLPASHGRLGGFHDLVMWFGASNLCDYPLGAKEFGVCNVEVEIEFFNI